MVKLEKLLDLVLEHMTNLTRYTRIDILMVKKVLPNDIDQFLSPLALAI